MLYSVFVSLNAYSKAVVDDMAQVALLVTLLVTSTTIRIKYFEEM